MPVVILLAALASAGLAGCGQEVETPERIAVEDAGYATPPTVSGVARQAGGALTISGRSGPDERIRLVDMNGRTHGATADAQGDFSVTLPNSGSGDHLLSLTVQRAGRAVSSDGWLFAPAAAPQRAVMLRPGAASLPVGPAPLLAVVDYDGGGGVALAGVTEPGADVALTLDGQPQGETTAGPDGRWSASLPLTVSVGSHVFVAVSAERRAATSLTLSDNSPTLPVEVSLANDAIRIDWRLPGGGDQSTWILRAG